MRIGVRRVAIGILLAASAAVSVSAASPVPGEATIAIEDFDFAPETVTIAVGGTVTWRARKDPEQHTVTPVDPGAFEGSDPLFEGDDFTLTFDTIGRFDYICTFHPFMAGTIDVVAGATSPTASPTPAVSPSGVEPAASATSSRPQPAEPADPSVAVVPAIAGLLAVVAVVLLWSVTSRGRSKPS